MSTPTLVASYGAGSNSTGATVAVTGVLPGDTLLACAVAGYTNPPAVTVTDGAVPGGDAGAWAAVGTDVGNTAASPAQNCGLAMRRRPCSGTGTYNVVAGSANESIIMVAHLRGQDASPLDGAPTTRVYGQDTSGAWPGTVTADAVTTATADALLIAFYGMMWFSGDQNWAQAGDMTERLDVACPNGNLNASMATRVLAASGSTGAKAATFGTGGVMYGLASGLVAVKGAVVTADTADMFLSSP